MLLEGKINRIWRCGKFHLRPRKMSADLRPSEGSALMGPRIPPRVTESCFRDRKEACGGAEVSAERGGQGVVRPHLP